ncbi:MAG: hypothetical protein PHI40_01020 [Caldisericia bacterium]|nr:hypothetical protein [Caldisericia bacterium]MDD4613977.1 hypothetical protein [Caldisericia bacterium]
MEFTSDGALRSWVHNHCFDTTNEYVKTEVDEDSSASFRFQERLAFFLLDYSYPTSITKESASRYFSFLYTLWKSVVLFGFSYAYPMEDKVTKLSLMHADNMLAHAATIFGTIEHHAKMGDLLNRTMLAITMNLKDQPISYVRDHSLHLSNTDWEDFQKKRYLPILLFFLDALTSFYDLQNYAMERILLYVYDLALQSDPIYESSQSNDFYYNKVLKTTSWKVIYVNNQNSGSSFYLPISSNSIERRDTAVSSK